MNISNDGIDITNRFFYAIDMLKKFKVIRGLQTFTRAHNIHYGNIAVVKKEPGKRIVKPEWIKWLCEDYDVSIDYIMFGKGHVFYDREAL